MAPSLRPARLFTVAAAAFFNLASLAAAQSAPTNAPSAGGQTLIGCYSSSDPLNENGTYLYQSIGYCKGRCVAMNQPVMALSGGNDCWCGNELPATSSMISNSSCNTPCTGYGQQTCGGNGAYAVYLTGTQSNMPSALDGVEPNQSSSTSTTQSVVTLSGQTVTATASSNPDSDKGSNNGHSGGSSTVGVAVGVVIGVVALLAIVLGVWFFLRRRRQRDAEEAYQRHAAVSGFLGDRPMTSSGDSRLDPSILQRRQSSGSIADNEDFSRRILRVTNPGEL